MTDITPLFPALADHDALEMGRILAPRFDANGLVTAVVVDVRTRDVVMLAHMNAEALARTIETGVATLPYPKNYPLKSVDDVFNG